MCTDTDVTFEYEMPYQNSVSKNPGFDEMKKVVVDRCIRPQVEEIWKTNEVGTGLCKSRFHTEGERGCLNYIIITLSRIISCMSK